MKRMIESVGSGRLIGAALVLGIVLGAIVAIPIVVSAGESDEPVVGNPGFADLIEQFKEFHEDYDESKPFSEDWKFGDLGLFFDDGEFGFGGNGWFDRFAEEATFSFSSSDIVADLTGTDVEEVNAALMDGQSLADFAAEHGVSEDELVEALVVDYTGKLNQKVADGDIDQETADDMLANADERFTALVNREGFARKIMPGIFEGHGFGSMFTRHISGAFTDLGTVAELTGTDRSDVVAALMEGQSLVEFAAEHGVSETELVDALVANIEEQVNEMVANGDLDQEKADELLTDLEERVTKMVNNEGMGFPGRFRGPYDCEDSEEDASISA